ncbi:hypothetical protein [Prauserella cavernicola]|uniref:Uncharacterized protein n=1 Tax=Prauserella cavernicola TaxID=2800127 RepID=A0A934QVF4_9PSEU|nr:hypothetical protein [Prauserella cavernicola]MBK1787260.1 hypothetical protein [Prauserella cavernicola]
MSAIEVFANSKPDHGLSPLEAGPVYMPVFCTTTTTTAAALGGLGMAFAAGVLSDACEDVHAGDVSSAGMPARGSATELLNFRTGSIS